MYKISSKSNDFKLRYGVRHLGIILPPYETTHEVSLAGRSCLSNFMLIWYTDLTPQRIFTVDTFKKADLCNYVPFGGLDDE